MASKLSLFIKTHIDNEGSGARGSGAPAGSQSSPSGTQGPRAPERLIVYVCNKYKIRPQNIFLFEEKLRFYIMGRGRKGLIDQSERRTKPSRGNSERGMPMTFFFTPNRVIKKYSYLNKPLILWKTWIHNSLSIFFCQTTTTGTLKHRVEMLLEAN